jgi:hypothetical protein
MVVFLPAESFFLDGTDDFTVPDDTCGAIMIIC